MPGKSCVQYIAINCNSKQCNEEGYTGNGTLCARDSDRDTFPDVNINCSLATCNMVHTHMLLTPPIW